MLLLVALTAALMSGGSVVAQGPVLATYGFGAGAATFGVALPKGAAQSGIKVGTLTTQTDVKTRWSDGSIRFAIVSANIPSNGSYQLTSAAASAGSFAPSWPVISLALTINGATWTASPGAFTPADLWLDGPVVREARVKTAPMNGGTPHPQLEVVFDIRSYASGGHRIDLTVQNVRDLTTIVKVPVSNVVLQVDGSSVWTHGPVTSYSMTRWRHVRWVGAAEAAVTPDFEPTYLAGALPRIMPNVINGTYDLAGPEYDLMGGRPASGYPAIAYGIMNPDMAAGGGRPEIGALNWWEAKYLVYKTQNQRAAVLRNADLTGAWSNHLTKADGTFIKLGDPGYSPTEWWWDIRGSAAHRPKAPIENNSKFMGAREGLDGTTDTGSVGVASRYNEEHVPAPMFIAYMISGDRYYVDQGKFWSTKAITSLWPTWLIPDGVNFPGWKRGRNGATGNERILDVSGMSREFAWPLRLIAYTSWMIPDSDPDKPYFLTTIQNNLNHAGAYYDLWTSLGYGGALGAIGMEENPNLTLVRNGQATGRYSSMWRMAYTAYSLDWCTRQELWTISSSVNSLVNRIVNVQVLMNLGNPNFLTGQAGLSYNAYPVFNTMSGGRFNKWFDNFAEVKLHNETYAYVDGALGWPGGWNPAQPNSGYYNVEHWVALQIALRRGVANAQQAVDRFKQVSGALGDTLGRSGFAITFTPGQMPSAPPTAPGNVRIIRQ